MIKRILNGQVESHQRMGLVAMLFALAVLLSMGFAVIFCIARLPHL